MKYVKETLPVLAMISPILILMLGGAVKAAGMINDNNTLTMVGKALGIGGFFAALVFLSIPTIVRRVVRERRARVNRQSD